MTDLEEKIRPHREIPTLSLSHYSSARLQKSRGPDLTWTGPRRRSKWIQSLMGSSITVERPAVVGERERVAVTCNGPRIVYGIAKSKSGIGKDANVTGYSIVS